MTSEQPDKDNKFKQKVPRKISAEYLYRSGLYYLERYASSTANFQNVMSRKIKRSCDFHGGTPSDHYTELETVIKQFIELGYLDDHSYARGQIRSYRRKGESARKISQRLKQKGVDDGIIEHALTEIDAEDLTHFDRYDADIEGIKNPDVKSALRYIARKKLGPFRRKIDEKSKQKDLASLARAGYSYNIASKALDLSNELKDNE